MSIQYFTTKPQLPDVSMGSVFLDSQAKVWNLLNLTKGLASKNLRMDDLSEKISL